MMLEPGPSPTPNGLMSSPEASHARTLAMQDLVQGLPESEADCFTSSPGSLARWDRELLSWKTSQRCFVEEWETFSGRWPRSGLIVDGIAYQQQPLVPRISGTGCLSSGVGVPTPTATDGRRGAETLEAKRKRGAHVGVSLNDYVARWPTPTARDWRSGKASEATRSRNSRPLSEAIGGLLNPRWVEWLQGFPEGWTNLEDSETQ